MNILSFDSMMLIERDTSNFNQFNIDCVYNTYKKKNRSYQIIRENIRVIFKLLKIVSQRMPVYYIQFIHIYLPENMCKNEKRPTTTQI